MTARSMRMKLRRRVSPWKNSIKTKMEKLRVKNIARNGPAVRVALEARAGKVANAVVETRQGKAVRGGRVVHNVLLQISNS